MKLGVNPSSASLFSSSPSTPDPGLYLPSAHLRSAKDTKENFGVIQKKWRQFPTSKSPYMDNKRLEAKRSRGGASVLPGSPVEMMDKPWGHRDSSLSDLSSTFMFLYNNKPSVRFSHCKIQLVLPLGGSWTAKIQIRIVKGLWASNLRQYVNLKVEFNLYF